VASVNKHARLVLVYTTLARDWNRLSPEVQLALCLDCSTCRHIHLGRAGGVGHAGITPKNGGEPMGERDFKRHTAADRG